MAQSAPDQARYLQEALAIARGTKSGGYTETRRIRAFGRLFGLVLDALVWLEDVASSMPEHLYDQSNVHQAVMHARKMIAAAGAWTEAEEQQANLAREAAHEDYEERAAEARIEREAELGPDLPSREEQEADAIASEFVDKEPEGVSLQEEIDRS